MTEERLLVLCASSVPTGAERMALFAARIARDAGLESDFACRGEPLAGLARAEGFETLTLPLRKAYDFASAATLRRVLHGQYGAVHTFNEVADAIACFAVVGTGARWLTTQTNTVTAAAPKRLLHQRLIGRSSGASAVSDALVRSWAGTLGWDVAFTPSPMLIEPLPLDAVARRTTRPVRIVTCLARMSRQKGVDTFVRVAARLRDAGLEFRFVGDDPSAEDAEPAFRRAVLADNERLSAAVRFLPRRADVTAALDESDVVVLPSRWEGTPQVLLEAMARGVPVVATAVPGNDEAVIDRETGILVAPEDAVGVARAVLALRDSPALRHQLAVGARVRVLAVYGPKTVAESLRRFYVSSGLVPDAGSRSPQAVAR